MAGRGRQSRTFCGLLLRTIDSHLSLDLADSTLLIEELDLSNVSEDGDFVKSDFLIDD